MSPILWLLVMCAVITVAAVGITRLLKHRRSRSAMLMPYGELRRQVFKHIGDPRTSRPCPIRPPGLDGRLDADQERELLRLAPLIGDQWQDAFDCYIKIVFSIGDELKAIDPEQGWYELLSPPRRAILAAWTLEAEVNNGGFDQFFLNSSGDGAAATPSALRLLGQEKFASLVEQANAQFPQGPPVSRALRLHQMARLPEQASKVWGTLDSQFYDLPSIDLDTTIPFILANRDEFFKPAKG